MSYNTLDRQPRFNDITDGNESQEGVKEIDKKHPWLDKPIETWSWEEIKGEYTRCGYASLLGFLIDLDPEITDEERRRRFRINDRTADPEVSHDMYVDRFPDCFK